MRGIESGRPDSRSRSSARASMSLARASEGPVGAHGSSNGYHSKLRKPSARAGAFAGRHPDRNHETLLAPPTSSLNSSPITTADNTAAVPELLYVQTPQILNTQHTTSHAMLV